MPGRRTPLLLVAWLVAACGSPLPSLAPPPTSTPPTPTSTAITTASVSPASSAPSADPIPSPPPSPSWIHFSANGFAFDYPAEWPVLAKDGFNGADAIPLVVGTGEWSNGCTTTETSVHCGASVFVVDPGEVVAEFSHRMHGPATPVYGAPPFDAHILQGGAAADIAAALNGAHVYVHIPGHSGFVINIRFGSPMTAAERALIDRIIASFSFSGELGRLAPRNWEPGSMGRGECVRIEFQGRLGRGDFGDVNLLTADGSFTFVQWPPGWQAKVGENGRSEIVDGLGNVVAREWDEVVLGGRGDSNRFRACADAVTVVRAFPTTTAADE